MLATHGRGIWIIDNISPLRQLTPDLMAKDAVVLEGPPSIQYFNAQGGWAQGDAAFVGPSRPNDAMITYYQKARHMFGDLKIEVFDPSGTELTEFTPKSKHKGLNRVPWSMRLPPPIIPPGAQVLFQASEGPRVLPGTYPVKLVKGDQTYNGQVTLVLDPRAKYNLDDRKAEYDLTLKLYKMLGHMSYEVAAILAVRDDATDRASKLPKEQSLKRAAGNVVNQGGRAALEDRGYERRRRDHRGRTHPRACGRAVWRRDSVRRTPHDLPGGAGGLARS